MYIISYMYHIWIYRLEYAKETVRYVIVRHYGIFFCEYVGPLLYILTYSCITQTMVW